MSGLINDTMAFWASLPDILRSTFWILVVTVVLILSVAFTTLWERKVIGWMQLRRGPNRVGSIFGFLPGIFQPFADVIKLLVKEVVIPAEANKVLFNKSEGLEPAILAKTDRPATKLSTSQSETQALAKADRPKAKTKANGSARKFLTEVDRSEDEILTLT